MNTTMIQLKALALWQAWQKVTGSAPPNDNALMLVLAQAIFETQAGNVWYDVKGTPSRCWGAADWRALNAAERAAFAAGELLIGAFLHGDGSTSMVHTPGSVGTLRGDSDPNTGAFKVWFAVFDTDAEGAAYMLRAGVRQARAALLDPECTPFDYAKALYVGCCYFGGVHAGARPCGHRPDPLNAAETANVQAYADAIAKNLPAIRLALATWTTPAPYAQVADTSVEGVTVNAGIESAPAAVEEAPADGNIMVTDAFAVAVNFRPQPRKNPDPIEAP